MPDPAARPVNLFDLVLKASFIVVVALLCGGTATAEHPRPEDPASLLFEAPQWAATRPGATLSYRYTRKSANEALYGPSFEDRIRLHIEKGDTEATRTVRVELFGRERRRAAGPFEDVSSNPVLMLFLEHHVEQLSRIVHANPRYLKNGIRAALRDTNKARMNGLEGLVYTLAVSEEVPGQVTELTAKATRPDGVAALEETLVYEAKE